MAEDEMLKRAKSAANFYKPRTDKIKAWYQFVRLVDEYAKEVTGNVETWVSPSPRSFRMLALHLLSTGKVRDRMPITVEGLTEREKLGDCERFLHSNWREKDSEQILAGRRLWRREFHDFGFMTGWFAVFYGTFANDDNSPYFCADILNPANVFQMWANNKLVGCYIYEALQEAEVRLLAKMQGWDSKDIPDNRAYSRRKTVDLWTGWELDGDQVIKGIFLQNKPVKNPDEVKEFWGEGIPILTGPIGGFSDRGTIRGDTEWIARMGESPLEPGRDITLKRNRLESHLRELVKKIANPTIIDKTKGGKGAISAEDVNGIIHLKIGEDAEVLRFDASALPAINVLLGEDSAEWQLTTIPAVAYGTTLGLELSGYAYNQMMTAAYSALGELNAVQNQVRAMIDKKWLDDFKKKWKKDYKIRISGQEVASKGFYTKDFGPENIPDITYVDVDSPLAMPSDFFQRINAARVAIPEGPLMDFDTMADELMKFDDPVLMKQKISEDVMNASPYMKQAYLIFDLRRRAAEEKKREGGNPEFARLLLQIADRILANLGMEQGAPSPRGLGIGPGQLPPEMYGRGREQLREIGYSRFGGMR